MLIIILKILKMANILFLKLLMPLSHQFQMHVNMSNKSFNLKMNIESLPMFKRNSFQFLPMLESVHEIRNIPFIIELLCRPSQLNILNNTCKIS